MGFIFGLLVIGIAFITLAGMWKIFEKAGKPGWAAIVPIYNTVILLEIVRKPWWWLILMVIPYIGIIWGVWAMNLLSKSFGKDEGYTIGILFLPFIFLPMLGFGDAEYIHDQIEGPKDDQVLDSDLV